VCVTVCVSVCACLSMYACAWERVGVKDISIESFVSNLLFVGIGSEV
jgi:hypothetical protein